MANSDEESEARLPMDSDSDEPRIEAKKEPLPQAEVTSSSDDESDVGIKLPSVEKAFEMVDKKGLTFAKYGDGVWKNRPKQAIAGDKSLEAVAEEETHGAEACVLATDEGVQQNEPVRERSRSPPNRPFKKPEFTSVKDRTKQKRLKGQSGEDHAGRQWKPDEWMKMRQEFD